MVTFINEHGAVHTTSKELFESNYRNCRKVTKTQLNKLGKLGEKVSELSELRLSAVDADGNADAKARTKAAVELQKAKAAEKAYRKEMNGEEADEEE